MPKALGILHHPQPLPRFWLRQEEFLPGLVQPEPEGAHSLEVLGSEVRLSKPTSRGLEAK